MVYQVRDLVITVSDHLRASLDRLSNVKRMERCARFRISGDPANPEEVTKLTLRTLARRYEMLAAEMGQFEQTLDRLTAFANPALRAAKGVGTETAAIILAAAGDNPGRLRNEAPFAAMCGVSPVEASSGKTVRHGPNRSGKRQAKPRHALWPIAMIRLGTYPATRTYRERRTSEGKTPREIMRCLKRYIAREIFRLLTKPRQVFNGDELHQSRNAAGITVTTAAAALETRPILISRLERSIHHNHDLAARHQTWLASQNAA